MVSVRAICSMLISVFNQVGLGFVFFLIFSCLGLCVLGTL